MAWVRRMESRGIQNYPKRFQSAEGCYSQRAVARDGIRMRMANKQFVGLTVDADYVIYSVDGAVWQCPRDASVEIGALALLDVGAVLGAAALVTLGRAAARRRLGRGMRADALEPDVRSSSSPTARRRRRRRRCRTRRQLLRAALPERRRLRDGERLPAGRLLFTSRSGRRLERPFGATTGISPSAIRATRRGAQLLGVARGDLGARHGERAPPAWSRGLLSEVNCHVHGVS